MKIGKKITNLLLIVCLIMPCFSIVAHAANGVITFSDPTTTVGQEVTVNVKMNASGSAIGDGNISVTYDTTALEFVNGENASGGNGSVVLNATGNGSVTELSYSMNFKALKEGETTIEVSDYKAYLYNDDSLNLTLGNSKVTIGAGDGTEEAKAVVPTDAVSVTVDGKKYTINELFTDIEIPLGFSKTTLMYEGKERQVLVQDKSGQYMISLQGENGETEFYFYNPDTDAFSPYVQVDISDKTYIMVINKSEKSALPKTYQTTTVDINGKEFGAWQNTEDASFYLVYALSSEGKMGYYQYDTVDGTYQRFTIPKEQTEGSKTTGLLSKIQSLVDKHLAYVLIGAWVIFLLFLILIIVLATKLHHRNQELDDLYDDFGDEEEDKFEYKDEKKTLFEGIKRNKEELDDFDDYEDDFDGYEDNFNDIEKSDFILKGTIKNNGIASVNEKAKPMKRASATIEPERKVKKNTGRNVDFNRFNDDDDDFSVDFIDFDD